VSVTTLCRGTLDAQGVNNRMQGRSKYGAKKPKAAKEEVKFQPQRRKKILSLLFIYIFYVDEPRGATDAICVRVPVNPIF